eukprot:m.53201 g.53201  ORF g.53201 m.53201 type:complete len:253 (-) comp12362_c0_seq1:50-808(-)
MKLPILPAIAVTISLFGTLFVLVGLTTPGWAVVHLEISGSDNPWLGRGLFEAAISDGEGVIVQVEYGEEDENGKSVDPFCGSAQAESVFGSRLLNFVLRNVEQNAPFDGMTYPELLVNDTVHFNPTRDNDTDDWCEKRDATIGLGVTAAVFGILSTLLGTCFSELRPGFGTAFIITALLATVFGLCASAVFGTWVDDYKDQPRVFASLLVVDDDVFFGFSGILFTVGWVLYLVSAILAAIALARADKLSTIV